MIDWRGNTDIRRCQQLEDLWFGRCSSSQDRKFISSWKQFRKTVATVDHLYMVDHVKFLMHLRLYGMLQHNHWGPDRLIWSFSANCWGPRPPEPPWLMSMVHWMSQRSTDTSDMIHVSLLLSTS